METVESNLSYTATTGTLIMYPITNEGGDHTQALLTLSLDDEKYWGSIVENHQGITHVSSIDYTIDNEETFQILHPLSEDNELIGYYDKESGYLSDTIYRFITGICSYDESILLAEDANGVSVFLEKKTGRVIYRFKETENADDASFFRNKYCCINDSENNSFTVIDDKGNIVIKYNGLIACSPVTDDTCVVINEAGSYGIVSISSDIIAECRYKMINEMSDHCYTVKNENNMWGVMDEKGNIIVPCEYELFDNGSFYFQDGYALLKLSGGNWIALDKKGNIIVFP